MTRGKAKLFRPLSAPPENPNQTAEGTAAIWDANINFVKQFDKSGQLSPESKLENYRNALAMLREGVCLFGPDFRIIFCNQHYLSIYNLQAEDVENGMPLVEVFRKRKLAGTLLLDSMIGHLEFFDVMKNTQEEASIKGRLADGRIIAVRGKALPNGIFITIHSDITEKEQENIAIQELMDRIPGYAWVKDSQSRFVVANKAMAADYGFADPKHMIGKNDTEIHSEEAAKGFLEIEQSIMRTREPRIDMEEAVVDVAGVKKLLLTTKVPIMKTSGEAFGLVGFSYDITDHKKSENFSIGKSRILEMIMTGVSTNAVLKELIALIEQRFDGINASVLLLGSDGKRIRHCVGSTLPESYRNTLKGAEIGPKAASCGTAMFRKEPVIVNDVETDPLWEDYRALTKLYAFRSCWSSPIISKRGEVLGSFALYSNNVRDPSRKEYSAMLRAAQLAAIAMEFRQDEKRINFLATHDYLTGLPNRALLNDRISSAYEVSKRANTALSVAFIDLDNFKIVNDSLDHNSGDAVLKIVAERIKRCVRGSDTVARFGGDEFVIVFQDRSKDLELLMQALKRIQISLAEPITIAEREFNITASIGVANYPEDCLSPSDIISSADAAMYKAKESGGNTFQFYSRELNAEFHRKLQLREELRLAVARNELTLVYQPQVDLQSGKVFAVETLVRWKHPTCGFISPAVFIPLAEESSLIVTLGDWVLNEACRQNKAWQALGLAPINVCVNISARQFAEKDFVQRVTDALEASGLSSQYLELELTESLLMQNSDEAADMMQQLRAIGVQIALDDFGTGYSSLSSLKKYPIGRLKIDKSFVDEIGIDEDEKIVAKTIIVLGHQLGMRVIAEGVETEAQRHFLTSNNCDEMQGYLFSKPVPAEDIALLLARNIPRHRTPALRSARQFAPKRAY